MKPREVIQGNLTRKDPERIGFDFDRGRQNDFLFAGIGESDTWKQRRWVEGEFEYYDDEWGNIWYRLKAMSQGGEIFKPVLDDWNRLDKYQLPDLADPLRYEEAKRLFAQETKKFRVGYLPGFPFAICRYLRKMENYFQDLLLERPRIDELHRRVTLLMERMIGQYAKCQADAIMFCEDWGTQERLLVSPSMWREIFKPLFRRLCGAAHEQNMSVLMHSCGYNWLILDDLAEVGVNAFQFDQPQLYGLERLAEKLEALKVCLYAPVDIQKVMPKGNKEEIVENVKQMVKLFGGKHGGLIAKCYPDLHGIGVKQEWDDWAYETFRYLQKLPA